MSMVMAVSFQRYGRLYYLDPGEHTPAVGDKVLVPTDAGPEVAECIWAPQYVSDDVGGLPVCAGLASEDDLARTERNRVTSASVARRAADWLPPNRSRTASTEVSESLPRAGSSLLTRRTA